MLLVLVHMLKGVTVLSHQIRLTQLFGYLAVLQLVMVHTLKVFKQSHLVMVHMLKVPLQ
jgi:hypothetical protein